jgi:predicted dehydrogenase
MRPGGSAIDGPHAGSDDRGMQFDCPFRWLLTVLAVAVIPCCLARSAEPAARPVERFRLGIVGLVHGHVHGFLDAAGKRADVEIVGVAESRADLLDRHGRQQYKLAPAVLFTDLNEMLDKARPQAVAIFTDTASHSHVVAACAQRGIHVMMEKPLAIDMDGARAIADSVRRGGIQAVVNYETTWYPNTQAAWSVVRENKSIGDIRKIVFHTGHPGPKELGCSPEFLEWLLDPARNGSGALHDFGCYGADIATWLMDGRRPDSVTAVTQQLKSDPAYARVDDEATIILTYGTAQVIIQASWNWPYNWKNMEVYGSRGSYITMDRAQYRLRVGDAAETLTEAKPIPAPTADPLSFFMAVAQGQTKELGLSSLEVNMVATEVLDAARRSAKTGQSIQLNTGAAPRQGQHENPG